MEKINRKEFIDFYNSHTTVETATHFKLSINTIHKYRKILGLKKKLKCTILDTTPQQEFIDFYNTHSTKEICDHYNVCVATVLKHAKKLNLKINIPGRKRGVLLKLTD